MDNNEKSNITIEKATAEDISPDKPLSFGSYLDLPLSEAQRDLWTTHIIERLNAILEDGDRKDIMELAEGWRNQYYGLVGEKTSPWAGCFNLDMRMTPKIQDAVVAQTEEAFDDTDPHWNVGPNPSKEILDIRAKQEKVLDYYEDSEMSNTEDLESIRHDAFLLGLGWEALIFERKIERIKDYKVYDILEQFVADFPNDYQKYPSYIKDLAEGKQISLVVEYNHEVCRSPKRRHIEFEDGIAPLNAKGVEGVNNADIRGRRVWMKWDEIKALEDDGDYIKGVSERLKYQPQLGSNGELLPDPEFETKEFETFELIYDLYLNIDGKKRKVRTMWNIETDHEVCLRAIRYPYNHNHSYLIPHCIKYTNKGLYQDGLGRMLQDLHLAANATINHILDSSVLANSLSLKAREGSDAARRIMEHRWYPGSVLELQNLNDAEQFNFSTPNLQSLIQMFGIIEKFAQDVSGIVNYQLGVESQEDPEAPASKTIALMRKAEIKLRRYIKNLKRSEDEVGYQSLRLIYQFADMRKISAILGENVEETKKYLQPPLKIVTQAAGFAIEKIFSKKDNMSMAEILLKAEPLVATNPVARARLWQVIAKDWGSNWDKKIIGIVPTPEDIEKQQAVIAKEKQDKKMATIQQAATQVLEQGGSPEEARNAGLQAGKMLDNMQANQQMAQQQQQQPMGGQPR
jgi:hypothetical protein